MLRAASAHAQTLKVGVCTRYGDPNAGVPVSTTPTPTPNPKTQSMRAQVADVVRQSRDEILRQSHLRNTHNKRDQGLQPPQQQQQAAPAPTATPGVGGRDAARPSAPRVEKPGDGQEEDDEEEDDGSGGSGWGVQGTKSRKKLAVRGCAPGPAPDAGSQPQRIALHSAWAHALARGPSAVCGRTCEDVPWCFGWGEYVLPVGWPARLMPVA